MATFLMFGKYSGGAIKDISAKRTDQSTATIEKYGGKYKSGYALMGDRDLVLIVEFPKIEQVVQCSLALQKLTGVSFSTSPALSIDQFDELATQVR